MIAKISAIVPCYNTEKEVLLQCINSILQQDYQNFEIIIVNDGSDIFYTKGMQEVANLDSRILLINQDNQGVSSARNNGLKKATGEYITFIDSDDKIVPYFFSEAYSIAKANDADYVVGCVYYTSSRNTMVPRYTNPQIIVKASRQYKTLLINVGMKYSDGSYFGRGSVARLIKRSILTGIFFQEDVTIGEDIIWNLDVISKCNKVYMIHQIWYIYWKNQESVTNKYNPNIITMCETHLHALMQRIDKNNKEELTAYCIHIGDLLRDEAFGCCYGRAECPLPIYKRYTSFCKLCQQKPWSLYQTFFSKIHYNLTTNIICLLIKCRLLYWVYLMRDILKKRIK